MLAVLGLFIGILLTNCGGGGAKGKSGILNDPNYQPLPERVAVPEAEKAEFFKNMSEIKGADFMMGSEDYDIDEKPKHKVTITGFWIDKYEVRISEFAKFVDATKYKTTAEIKGRSKIFKEGWNDVPKAYWSKPKRGMPIPDQDNQPVTHVSWYDAKEYCSWAKKRLPTEAEWEFMAGGPEHAMYPTGNEFKGDLVVWNVQESEDTNTKPVGSKGSQNSYGLYDVAGNVWEWVSTLYDNFPYPYKIDDGRENYNKVEGQRRTFRGGSAWNNEVRIFRVANRSSKGDPEYTALNLGFRCVY